MADFNITPADFRKLPGRERSAILNGLSSADRVLMRMLVRIDTLKEAEGKLKAWLKAHPKEHSGAEGRRHRLAEYKTSLDNLAKYRQEKPPTGNPVGVDIAAPHVFTGSTGG